MSRESFRPEIVTQKIFTSISSVRSQIGCIKTSQGLVANTDAEKADVF